MAVGERPFCVVGSRALGGTGLQIIKVVRGTVYISGTYFAQYACTTLG
jgi:hypothetical protein